MRFLCCLQSALNTMLSKVVLPFVLAVALFVLCSTVCAQGTESGPSTIHDVVSGPVVYIGDGANPMPIDLDPTGPAWTKGLFDPNGLAAGNVTVDIFETIQNVGTEPWSDWHEHIIGDPISANGSSFWSNVVSLEVNGNPILFNVTGLGTKDLTLDQFSPLVQFGDIFTIHKQVDVFNLAGETSAPLIRMQEYPTSIPEPTTIVLLLTGTLGFLFYRIRRK